MTAVENKSILIQSNWKEQLETGEIWVTLKEVGKPGDHDKLRKENNSFIAKEEKFNAEIVKKHSLKVTHLQSSTCKLFLGPSDSFNNINEGNGILSLDAGSGGLGVLSGNSKDIRIWDTSNGTVRRVLQGHVGEVYRVKLFPSGVVVLSGGADMQLKIWSATDGNCPVTLKGHTQAITDFAMVDKGKNVISVSKDGSARLWSCGEGKCLSVLTNLEDIINCCHLSDETSFLPQERINKTVNGEVGTENKLLALGGENGSIEIIDVAGRKSVFSSRISSSVNSVYLSKSCLFVGCQSGEVYTFLPNGSKNTLLCSQSPVLSLIPCFGSLCVARQDGSVTIHDTSGNASHSPLELTGSDSDPVYQVADDESFLYTGSRDGVVRKYSKEQIKKVLFK